MSIIKDKEFEKKKKRIDAAINRATYEASKVMEYKPYSLEKIMETDAQYYMIIGERSNGKTHTTLVHCLRDYVLYGKEFAYVRRWDRDIKGNRGQQVFAGIVATGIIPALTDGEYDDIVFWRREWYFSKTDEKGRRIKSEHPFAYAFAINIAQGDKSTSYPHVDNIVFDEFMDRDFYIDNEFIEFSNLLSTIIRHRNNVKVFMLGNTVSKECPYFREMGLYKVKDMPSGRIDEYTYGDSKLKVRVERCNGLSHSKKSDVYFAFNNPQLKMITKGEWEIANYPHMQQEMKYRPMDVQFNFFIKYYDDLLHCECVNKDGMAFIFVHPKTTPIKDPDDELVYSVDYDPRPNFRRNILKPLYPVENSIARLMKEDKVFYSDNETGEVLRNYLMWCVKH